MATRQQAHTGKAVEREKAAIGAPVTLREPTKPMLAEAAAAGYGPQSLLCAEASGLGSTNRPRQLRIRHGLWSG